MSTKLVSITQAKDLSENEVGKFAQQLSQFTHKNLNIQEGFIVKSSSIWEFIDSLQIDKIWTSTIANLPTTELDIKSIKQLSNPIIEQINKAKLPSILSEEVLKAYSNLSGFSESFVNISYIGDIKEFQYNVNSKKLNVRGFENILNEIKNIVKELFEPNLLLRLYNSQISPFTVELPILIQKTFQPDSSGVLRNKSLLNPDKNYCQIEVVLGMIDPIFLNELSPEIYEVDLSTLKVTNSVIRSQEWMLIRNTAKNSLSATTRIAISEKWRNKPKLSDKMIAKLAAIVQDLNKNSLVSLNYEIDFSIENDKIWILRANTGLSKFVVNQQVSTSNLDENVVALTPKDEINDDNVNSHINTQVSEEPKESRSKAIVYKNNKIVSNPTNANPNTYAYDVLYGNKSSIIDKFNQTIPPYLPVQANIPIESVNKYEKVIDPLRIIILNSFTAKLCANKVVKKFVRNYSTSRLDILKKQQWAFDKLYGERVNTGELIKKENMTLRVPSNETKYIINQEENSLELINFKEFDQLRNKNKQTHKTATKILLELDSIDELDINHVLKTDYVIYRNNDLEKFNKSILSICEIFSSKEILYEIPIYPGIKYTTSNVSSLEPYLQIIKNIRNKVGYKNLHVLIPNIKTYEEYQLIKLYLADNGLKKSNLLKIYISIDNILIANHLTEILESNDDGFILNLGELFRLNLGYDKSKFENTKAKLYEDYNILDLGLINIFKKNILDIISSNKKIFVNLSDMNTDNLQSITNFIVENDFDGVVIKLDKMDEEIELLSHKEATKILKKGVLNHQE